MNTGKNAHSMPNDTQSISTGANTPHLKGLKGLNINEVLYIYHLNNSIASLNLSIQISKHGPGQTQFCSTQFSAKCVS